MISVLWYLWFFKWEGLKEILEPIPEITDDFLEESLENFTERVTLQVLSNKDITDTEKEHALQWIKENYESAEDLEGVSEELEEGITRGILELKIMTLVALIADSLLALSPAILAILGYYGAAVVLFGILGVMGSISLTNTLEEEGIDPGLLDKLVVVATIIGTQVPYITVLLVDTLL